MKGFYLCILLIFSITYNAQAYLKFKPIDSLTNKEDKKLYSLLKKAIIKHEGTSEIHFIPTYSLTKTYDYYSVFTIYYYKKTEQPKDYNSKSRGVYISQLFFKIKKNDEEFDFIDDRIAGTKSDEPPMPYINDIDKKTKGTPQQYNIEVYYKDDKKKKLIYSEKSKTPFFSELHTDFAFKSEQTVYPIIDSSIYNSKYRYSTFANYNYAIVNDGKFHGVINNKNKILIPFEYISIRQYFGNFLAHKRNIAYFLNFKNEKISDEYETISEIFSMTKEFSPKVFKVKKDNKESFLDSNFKVLKPFIYDEIENK